MGAGVQLAPVPQTDLARIPGVVAGLRQAFESGKSRPLAWRKEQLGRLRALFTENTERLIAALQADLGKPEIEAYTTDLSVVVQEIDLILANLERWTKPEAVTTPFTVKPGSSRILREPLGVVLVISPWNYPVQLLLSPLAGSIAAGNCTLLKPSELTETVSATLAELVPQYMDRDCVALVEGGIPQTNALLEQRFDHIFYTGNGAVARIVMRAAAEHLTPVTLELGGKSPCIIAKDANLDVAARRIAWGKWLNAGQTCIAPDYVLVEESVEEAFLEKLRATIKEFYGDDPLKTSDFGRIVNERHHGRLMGLLEGQPVWHGGRSDVASRYIEPTIVRNPAPDSKLMQDEIFGPILAVLKVESVDAAIRFVNAREKPLALYVFSSSENTSEAVLNQTSSGGACVNATIWHVANPHLPFGGVGPSGMGSYHGRATFETLSHHKSVVSKSTWIDPKIAYPPYTAFKRNLLRRVM